MKKYKNYTLKEYTDILSKKTPVPGGGSVAALSGALGVSLISMVAHYSKGRGRNRSVEDRIDNIIKNCDKIKSRFLHLVDLDARVYLKVVQTKDSSEKVKKKALNGAIKVPLEVCNLCYDAVKLTPYLVKNGNKYLISDIEIAVEMIFAAFNASLVNINVNI